MTPHARHAQHDARQRRRTVALLGCLALIGSLAACSASPSATGTTAGAHSEATAGPSPAPLHPNVVTTLPVAMWLSGPAVTQQRLWYWDEGHGTITSVDRRTGQLGRTISLGPSDRSPYGSPKTVAVGPSGVWVADALHQRLLRIDPATQTVVARVPLTPPRGSKVTGPITPFGLLVDAHGVWTTDFDRGLLAHVDPAKAVVDKVTSLAAGAGNIDEGFGTLWVAEDHASKVARVSPTTGAVVAQIDVKTAAGPCEGCFDRVVVDGSSIWVPFYNQQVLLRIDPSRDAVTQEFHTDVTLGGTVIAGGDLWIAGGDGTPDPHAQVERLDESTGVVKQRIPVPYAAGVAALPTDNPTTLWVTTVQGETSGSLQELKIDG